MLTFLIICALMVVLALWFVLPTLLQSDPNVTNDEERAANLLVYRDQFRELEADLKNGLLSESQFQNDKEALERRLLEDVPKKESQLASRPAVSRTLVYAIAIAIPVAAIICYLAIGNPKAMQVPAGNNPTSAPGVR
jgi:cytochrome c-type biogenesis protein CcmH